MKRTMTWALAAILLCCSPAWAKKSNKTQVAENLNIFGSIYKELQTNYVDSLDAEKTIRNAIDAMLGLIDPYTEYYPQSEQEDLLSISSGEFSGIGCVISQRNGKVVLNKPSWDSPSRKAGVKHGDILLAIDGDTLPNGYSTSAASARLRGPAGTQLTVTVQRPYVSDSIMDITITRGNIRNNPVPYYGMRPDGIGYISLTAFNEMSAQKVKEALLDLKKNPELKGLMLDLRDNGGGLLESAVQIAGYFVPKGTEIVTTKYRDPNNKKVYKTTQSPIDLQLPLAVLINDNTASASEILAGSLQDLDRAVIVGDRSFGKGLVQTSRPLPYDGLLKMTVARYYIPSGRLVQAIDYSHRNPDGSPARIPDSLTTVFYTANGREVRDGGGITPDIKVKRQDFNRLLYNLIADYWIYDYANRFAARQGDNMPANDEEFVITDSIFADFKAFIDPDKLQYDRLCDSGIKFLREAAAQEGYESPEVTEQLNQLELLLRHNLEHDLDFNKEEIKAFMLEEIIDRYYSDGVGIKRNLDSDDDVKAAEKVLSNPQEYKSLLGAPAKK